MKDNSEIPVSLKELDDNGTIQKIWGLEEKNSFRLGRGQGNDITLPYSWVSRKHTMIQHDANNIYSIFDMGSSNGTYLNGKRVFTPTILHSGDQITIGKTKLIFFQNNAMLENIPPEQDTTLDRTVAFLQKEIVTILVCDLRNFTHLSEQMGAQYISKLLQYWTKKVSQIITSRDGIVDKFIGDAVMAIWLGGNHSVNVRQALTAALEINVFTRDMGTSMKNIPIQMGIGASMNTGEAVMGNMGVDGQRDFTVIGDVVNVAFRLEELASKVKMDILLGGETAKHIPGADHYFTAKGYNVRGKEERILTYGCSFKQLADFLSLTAIA